MITEIAGYFKGKCDFFQEEIEMEVSLKKRIEFICDFAKVKPKFINNIGRKIALHIKDLCNFEEK